MWFRVIYDELASFTGDELVPDPLEPMMHEAIDELGRATHLQRYDASFDFDQESSWNWYALSRVHDWLILDAQRDIPLDARNDWNGPRLPAGYVTTMFERLGFRRVTATEFHPFFHEIVAIEDDEDATSPIVSKVWWDGWMWGEMMFARAGVTVRSAPGTFDRRLAVGAPLYFAFTRLKREAMDLSHGWGHNSQWRTDFRRDYLTPDAFRYNVDAPWQIGSGEPTDEEGIAVLNGLSRDTRIELLRFRSLVRTTHPEPRELWPFDDRHDEPR